jgi:hypothetical protein
VTPNTPKSGVDKIARYVFFKILRSWMTDERKNQSENARLIRPINEDNIIVSP